MAGSDGAPPPGRSRGDSAHAMLRSKRTAAARESAAVSPRHEYCCNLHIGMIGPSRADRTVGPT